MSQTLVSKVLNHKQKNIPEKTCRRIWDHAQKIGYRPKGMLFKFPATNVGFILRHGLRLHTQSQFWSQVQHGMHTCLLAQGYHSVFLGSEDELDPQKIQERLRSQQFVGLAILGQVDEGFLKAIRAVQPNLVTISVSYPGLCHSVMPNEKQALSLLVEHLTELGHRQFAWLGGDRGLTYNLRRHDALIEVLSQHGLKLSDKFAVNVESGGWLSGWKACEIILGQISRKCFPTAWVCTSGLIARGVINCLSQNGWRVPKDISVVAVDAARVCVEEHPQLTSAHADPEKIGQTAAELLLKRGERNDQDLFDVVLSSHLTVRESSAEAAH